MKTKPFNSADYLTTPEVRALYGEEMRKLRDLSIESLDDIFGAATEHARRDATMNPDKSVVFTGVLQGDPMGGPCNGASDLPAYTPSGYTAPDKDIEAKKDPA